MLECLAGRDAFWKSRREAAGENGGVSRAKGAKSAKDCFWSLSVLCVTPLDLSEKGALQFVCRRHLRQPCAAAQSRSERAGKISRAKDAKIAKDLLCDLSVLCAKTPRPLRRTGVRVRVSAPLAALRGATPHFSRKGAKTQSKPGRSGLGLEFPSPSCHEQSVAWPLRFLGVFAPQRLRHIPRL